MIVVLITTIREGGRVFQVEGGEVKLLSRVGRKGVHSAI